MPRRAHSTARSLQFGTPRWIGMLGMALLLLVLTPTSSEARSGSRPTRLAYVVSPPPATRGMMPSYLPRLPKDAEPMPSVAAERRPSPHQLAARRPHGHHLPRHLRQRHHHGHHLRSRSEGVRLRNDGIQSSGGCRGHSNGPRNCHPGDKHHRARAISRKEYSDLFGEFQALGRRSDRALGRRMGICGPPNARAVNCNVRR
jgi:hypothetical protein